MASGIAEQMSEIGERLTNYETRNICNVDESGLFHRMRAGQSYLACNEYGKKTLGTELHEHKMRITIERRLKSLFTRYTRLESQRVPPAYIMADILHYRFNIGLRVMNLLV